MLNLFSASRATRKPMKPAVCHSQTKPDMLNDANYSLLSDDSHILPIINRLIHEHAPVRLLSSGSVVPFTTELVALDHNRGGILVRAHSDLAERMLVETGEAVQLSFEQGGEPMLLTMRYLGNSQEGMQLCYCFELPSLALAVHFRDHTRFRVRHQKRCQQLLGQFFGCEQIPLIFDLSEGGLALLAESQHVCLLENSRPFSIGELGARQTGEKRIHMRLCHSRPVSKSRHMIGAQFMALDSQQERQLRHLILVVQAP